MAELMRNNGQSCSSSNEDSAAERSTQQGAEPTAVARQISAAGASGGGVRGYTTSATETTFREDASRSVGVTGRREAAVPVKTGPARGQPDRTRGAGEWGSYTGGELGVGYDMPLPRLALKHTAFTQFSGKKPKIHCLDQRRQVLRHRSSFPVRVCVASTPVRSRRGIGYRNLGTCRKGVQPRSCTHTCTRLEFFIDALLAWYVL